MSEADRNGLREPLWDMWAPVLERASLWTPSTQRTVVISPHPDDEVLSSGGLIAQQRLRGVEVVIVAVTDGDAAYDAFGDPRLAEIRRNEQIQAVKHLGVGEARIVRIGISDGHVTDDETRLCATLRDTIRPGDNVITPWPHDHHPDHEATGRATIAAVADIACTVRFSPFWTWWNTRPAALDDTTDIVRLPLLRSSVDAKQRALAEHVSQFDAPDGSDPILDHEHAEPIRWGDEFYLDPHHSQGAR